MDLNQTLPLLLGLAWLLPLVSFVLIVLFGFFFVTVSSRITGEIGSSSNPISGMTVATLLSNWDYMVMGSLAWTLKAWFALLLPEGGRWAELHGREKLAVLRMEFKTFLNAFMRVPAQVVRTGRRIAFRLLSWNPWQNVFLRGVDQLHGRMKC